MRKYDVFRTAAWVLLAGAASAQESRGTILGRVTDAQQAAVPGVSVVVRNTATGVKTTATTNESGDYYAPFLVPGIYELNVEHPGFKSYKSSGIEVRMLDRVRLDIGLEVGSLSESITVTDAAPMLDLTTGARGELVSQKMVSELPLSGHTSVMLVRLMPGVGGGARTFARTYDTGTVIDFSMSGGVRRRNEILLDGVTNATSDFQISHIPSADAVAEVKVQTNAYDAEYGHTTGGIVNAMTKSGTNALHGTVYNYTQNTALDANSFFNNLNGVKRPTRRYNQFGFNTGGPAYLPKLYDGRNRTFFFVNYEGIRNADGRSSLHTVPAPQQLQGDFSQTLNQNGALIVIHDPSTTRADPARPGNYIRDAFAGNRIPASRINSTASNLAKYYPAPNVQGARYTNASNYAYAGSSRDDYNSFIGRIDHSLTDKQRLFLRGHWNRRFQRDDDTYGPDNPAGDLYYLGRRGSYGAALDYTNTITATLLLNLRYGYSRFEDPIQNLSAGFDLVKTGFPQALVSQLPEVVFPTLSPSGYGTLGYGGSSMAALDSHTFQGVVTRILGTHTMRAGGDYRIYRNNPKSSSNVSGSYSFSASFTQGPDPLRSTATAGNAMASMLIGLPSSGSVDSIDTMAYRAPYAALFVQDDLRVSRRLTINGGLRFDYNGAWSERYNRMTRGFAFDTASPLQIPGLSLRGGLLYVNKDGQPATNSRGGNGWGPRLGFAYDIGRGTVLRGGFGQFFAGTTYFGVGSDTAQGYSVTTSYVPSIDGGLTPANSLTNPFPTGLLKPSGNSLGLSTLLGQSIRFFDPSVNVPGSQQFSLSLGKQFARNYLVEISYVGNRGVHCPIPSIQWNQLTPEQLRQGTTLIQSVSNPFYGKIASGALAGVTVTRSRLLRPFPQFDQITEVFPTRGSSRYHSMQSKFEHRFVSGVTVISTYTLSKVLQDFERSGDAAQNNYDLRNEWAVSSSDRTHRFTAAWVAELPFGRGKPLGAHAPAVLNRIISNWQFNGILTLESGTPLSFSVTPNNTNALGGGARPNSTGVAARRDSYQNRDDMLNKYFDTSQFTRPDTFQFGNLGRRVNDVRGYPFNTLDLSLFWKTPVREKVFFHLRLEAFDAINRADFDNPNTSLGNVSFGRVSALKQEANPARQVQLSARITF